MPRDNFLERTKQILAKRVCYQCSNPNCRHFTSGPSDDINKFINIGVAAHICAASEGFLRYDPNMTSEERRHINNGIWLCASCAKLIDSDKAFTVEILHMWKLRAEKEALDRIRGVRLEHITLFINHEIPIVNEIISVFESSNVLSFLRHDFRGKYERRLLTPLLELYNLLKLPSKKIFNAGLSNAVGNLLYELDRVLWFIAMKGGPSDHDISLGIIDDQKDAEQLNGFCDSLWHEYELFISIYRTAQYAYELSQPLTHKT